MKHAELYRRTWTIRMPAVIGVSAMLFLGLAGGLWGTQTQISGAVIGKGQVRVAENATAVQHPIGGVVQDILAQNGDRVAAGQLIVRLDDGTLQSKLAIVEGQLLETLATEARLDAVLVEADDLLLHPLLDTDLATAPGLEMLLTQHRALLDLHYTSLDTEAGLLEQQIEQVRRQIGGVDAELSALHEGLDVVQAELEKSQDLFERNLLKHSVYHQQQKELIKARGDIGRLEARRAELTGRIAELELKRHTLAPQAQQKAADELAKLRISRVKYLEDRLQLLSDLAQLEVRAPVAGRVHESKLAGVQSVVEKAKTLMHIVPEDVPVTVQVRIDSNDVDQVHFGQEAALRFEAFSRRETPLILGYVSNISPDALLDTTTKKTYYEVDVSFKDGELDKLRPEQALIPGMPANAFISTQARTPLNYVTGPLMGYLTRAFRDG